MDRAIIPGVIGPSGGPGRDGIPGGTGESGRPGSDGRNGNPGPPGKLFTCISILKTYGNLCCC